MVNSDQFTVSSDKVKAIKVCTSLVHACLYADYRANRFPNRLYSVIDYRGRHVYQAKAGHVMKVLN